MGKSLTGKQLGRGISQRKDGLYVARYVNRFGKRESVYGKTISEVTKKLREAQYTDDKQLNLTNPNMKLDEWVDIWFTVFKSYCRVTTINSYHTIYNRVKDDLGWRKVSSIKSIHIQDALRKLKTDNMREDCKALLSDIFKHAINSDMIIKNPTCGVKVKLNNESANERRILSDHEVDLLYKVCPHNRMVYKLFVIALNTGMRIGEIIGLTWENVDFENNMIMVRQTLCYIPNDKVNAIYVLHPPKTPTGIRNIPMSKQVKDILLEQKKRCELVNSRHPAEHGLGNLVFITRSNKPVNEANIRCTIRYYIDKIHELYPDEDFAPFTMHCLRHTYATNAIAAGMKPKVLQKILGHKSLQMTMDLYSHVRDDLMRDEMGKLTEMA